MLLPSTSTSNVSLLGKKSRVSRGGSGGSRKSQGSRRGLNADNKPSTQEDTSDEADVCIICANKVGYSAIGPCNHPVCHRCGFRQRALYEKDACLVCRSDIDRLIITEQIGKNYNDFPASSIHAHDPKYNIDFTAGYAKADTLGLLDIKCKICNNKEIFGSFKLLSEHVKNEHHKYFCLICANNKKSFIPELKLYNFKQLQKHQGEGDEPGFFGHPECKHCRGRRFYSEDELNIHIRDNHERCHICDQNNPKTADYYKNYDSLFQHFRKDHYVCNFPICLEKKFVVFREDLDLTAHMLKEHGGLASGSKVVIGATGRQYQSQLSTFSGLGQSSLSVNNNHNDEEIDTFDTKKKRLDERAKHYLHSDASKIRDFQKLNAQFRSKNITARELLKNYQELFTDKSPEDINLLVYEMSELFPENSQERKALANISEELVVSSSRERFPMLNGASGSSTASIHSWGMRKLQLLLPSELFPALIKPPKQKTNQLASTKQPIRYTKVLKKSGGSSSPVVSTSQAPINYKPTYLNSRNSSPTIDSLPMLGNSSSSSLSSSSSSSSSPKVIIQPKPTPSSSSSLLNSKFPTLEKKLAKKPIPRVNPVVVPTSWGPGTNGSSSKQNSSNDLDFGVPLVIKKKKNGRL